MILYKVTFGPASEIKQSSEEDEDSKEIADRYLATLEQYGLVASRYFPVIEDGYLRAYLDAHGVGAQARKYLPKHGREHFDKLVAHFGSEPHWEQLNDEAPKRDTLWRNAPFLYLFTHLYDGESPLMRGDNGKPIPLYRLPDVGERKTIWYTNTWQCDYRELDSVFMGSGAVEIPAYRQLVVHDSNLSQHGREKCAEIEKMTGVPTYYFLLRHWGRRQNEEKRKCPGCGGSWRTKHPIMKPFEDYCFREFRFRCDKCRLVSHMACTDEDERHARIGEWRQR